MKTNMGEEKAWQKIKTFCAYQERCHREVKEKLYGFGLYKKEVELMMSRLVEENYLNEERFAIAFAGGKFRLKQWGLVKIRYELKQKGVSEYCVKKALASIHGGDYEETLKKLYEKKRQTLNESDPYKKRIKIQSYLMQKGYAADSIQKIMQQ